jgi:NRPS condensation-like uncharacterized protein
MKNIADTQTEYKNHGLGWYRLDTSAKIYPAIESARDPAVFRVSMRLNEKVDEDTLRIAAEDVKKRFPYYNVHLHKGLFWDYLEPNKNDILIWHDTPSPCERLYRRTNNGYLYKIKYFDKNIAVEFFHVLTDGYGAMEYLKCLVHRYLYLKGKLSEKLQGIIDIDEKPHPDEYEDAFLKALELGKNIPDNKDRTLFAKSSTFHIKDKLVPMNMYYMVTGVVNVLDIKTVAKKYDATITQLLAALYIEALILLQDKQVKNKADHKNAAIEIPVNMRKYYPINSMRNFSLFVIPTVNPREIAEFEDIISAVKEFMAEHLTHEHLVSMVKDNCSIASNKIIKHVPMWVKNFVISYLSNTAGKMQFSGTISNIGLIRLPGEMQKLVENVQFMVGASPIIKRSSAVSGYKGKIYISFGRSVRDSSVERHIFTRLVKMGVRVKVKSNY